MDKEKNDSMPNNTPGGPEQKEGYRERITTFLNKNGFFVVAGLCAVCIGIAALAALVPGQGAPAPTPTPNAQTAMEAPVEPSPLPTPVFAPEAEPADTSVETSADAPTEEPAQTMADASKSGSSGKAKSKAPAPVDGAIVWDYAADTLLYSKTLDQWTTHEGIDLAAKQGTQVKAVRPGTVKRVYEDDALGVTVVVEHENGLTSLYANLQQKPPVTEGQPVKAGDVVGLVGDTAASECALESHVHFELWKDGKPDDPKNHVLIGK